MKLIGIRGIKIIPGIMQNTNPKVTISVVSARTTIELKKCCPTAKIFDTGHF
jgi:hypothetical protein